MAAQTSNKQRSVPTLEVLATGSSGNSYILRCGEDILLLECGIHFKEVLMSLDYDITGVQGVLVTHKHGDHAKYILEYKRFFRVYGNRETPNVLRLEAQKKYKMGNFKVIPFEVPHQDCLCFAYVIYHPLIGYTLFCTDAECFPYSIPPRLSNIIIESNYINEIVFERLARGEEVHSNYRSHMELKETIRTVSNLSSEFLRNVILIHRSKDNFYSQMARNEFLRDLCMEPHIAKAGDVINLGECDY